MLEVFVKIICLILLTISGFIIIKKITDSDEKLTEPNNIILLLISQIIPCLIYRTTYKSLYTLIVYFINVLLYKYIFKKNIPESIILTSIVMIISFFADLVSVILVTQIAPVELIRQTWHLMLLSNIISVISSVCIIHIKPILLFCRKIYDKLLNIKYTNSVIFIVLLILVFTIVANNIAANNIVNMSFILNLLIVTIFLVMLIIYTDEKSKYDNLTKRYDELFTYINEFEDWIEKEQFNRHEYKNQLAVLRCLTKEKKVKDKIDEILEDSIKLEGKIIHELKWLPKGGIKGLMYYKSAIAQKNKIDLTVNVSIEFRSLLSKLSDEDIRTICKLIGVYYDNAIEAAAETRKKIILVEIYELKERVSFVFSNTFKKHSNFEERNKKGVSSKGEGHGNGLYFANKLLEKNKWLESKQEIIDKYYVQQLIVHKK